MGLVNTSDYSSTLTAKKREIRGATRQHTAHGAAHRNRDDPARRQRARVSCVEFPPSMAIVVVERSHLLPGGANAVTGKPSAAAASHYGETRRSSSSAVGGVVEHEYGVVTNQRAPRSRGGRGEGGRRIPSFFVVVCVGVCTDTRRRGRDGDRRVCWRWGRC